MYLYLIGACQSYAPVDVTTYSLTLLQRVNDVIIYHLYCGCATDMYLFAAVDSVILNNITPQLCWRVVDMTHREDLQWSLIYPPGIFVQHLTHFPAKIVLQPLHRLPQQI